MSKIAKNYAAFKAGIDNHDRVNPSHRAHGIGLAHFDMERLGFEDGETLYGGITVQTDDGCTGNFRVLCDGQHNAHDSAEVEASEPVKAVTPDREVIAA